VILMRICEDNESRGVELVAIGLVPIDGGAECCRSCLGIEIEFQSTGAWWIKDCTNCTKHKHIIRTIKNTAIYMLLKKSAFTQLQ